MFSIAVATDIGFVNLEHATQPVAMIPFGHRQSQPVLEVECRMVSDIHMLGQRHGRDALLVRHEIDRQEHLGQWDLQLLEDGALRDAALRPTRPI